MIMLSVLFLTSCAMLFKTHYMDAINLGRLKDGVYTGEDKTFFCTVKLNVEIEDNKIKNSYWLKI